MFKEKMPAIDRTLTLFLRLWLMASVFVVPLIVVSFAYSAQGLQQLALTAFSLVGALVFLTRALAVRQEFVWRRSPLNAGLVVLSGAVVLVSLFSGRLGTVWGMSGFIPQVSPWGWLSAILLAVLIIQESGAQPGRAGLSPRSLLAAYCLSSTFLVLFVLGWYGSRNQFLIPWGITAQAAALWLAVNAAAVFMLASFASRSLAWFWFAAGLAHAALLFFFDYDLLWFVLGGFLLIFAFLQFSLHKRFARADFVMPQLGVLVAVVLFLVPSSWLFGGGAPQFWSGNMANRAISQWRWQNYAWPDKKAAVFGAGEGLGTLSFWQTAELVDMRQAINYPLLGNGWLNLLWDGGIVLAAAFLALILCLIVAAIKSLRAGPDDEPDQSLPVFLIAGIGIIASLASFYFLPVTFIHLFTVFFLSAILAAIFSRSSFTWTVGESEERRFASALAVVAPILLAGGIVFAWTRQFQSRLAFLRTITTNAQGQPVVNVDKLQRAVDYSPSAFGYRLSRNDIALQLLSQQNKPKFEEVAGLFVGLRADTQYLIAQNLTGPERWQAAWQAELTAANLEFKEFSDKEKGALNGPAKEWYQVSGALYEQALRQITRNVVLLTEAARFYRQHAALLAAPETPAANFYERSKVLAEQALAIDPSYEGGYLEKIELAAITKSPAEAIADIAGFAEKGPNVAYRAGLLAFAAKNYGLAIQYYRNAVDQNANHLAARYELVRAYAAAGESEKGRKELSELESKLPKGNEQADRLLKDLRALFSAAPEPAGQPAEETKK